MSVTLHHHLYPRLPPDQIKGKQDHHVTGQKTPLLQLKEQLEEQDPVQGVKQQADLEKFL